jgi:hypothetical protein
MKTKTLLLTALVFSLFSSVVFSSNPPFKNPFGKDDKCLVITGTLMADGKKVPDVEVSLLSDGKVEESFVSKGSKDIKFKLIRDKEYSVVVKKEGFVPAVFVISTKLPKTVTEYNYHVEFTYDMIPDKNTLNKEYLDYPAAYFMYYKSRDEFAVSKKYITHIKKCLGKS